MKKKIVFIKSVEKEGYANRMLPSYPNTPHHPAPERGIFISTPEAIPA
jgi:hypothetical protein